MEQTANCLVIYFKFSVIFPSHSIFIITITLRLVAFNLYLIFSEISTDITAFLWADINLFNADQSLNT